jgi:hypothetical protein
MKSAQLIRRIIGILLLAVALGCSGLSSLLVQNQTSKPVQVHIEAKLQEGHGPDAEFSGTVGSGDEIETVNWFQTAPISIKVEADVDGRKANRTWTMVDYPPGLARGTSGGAYFVLEVRDNKLNLRDPTGWDKMRRNPQYYLLPLVCMAVLGICISLFVIAVMRLRKRGLT